MAAAREKLKLWLEKNKIFGRLLLGFVAIAIGVLGFEQWQDDREQKHRAQAQLISVWYDDGYIAVQNTSSQSVTNAVLSLVFTQGAGGPSEGEDADRQSVLAEVPTGKWAVAVEPGWGAMGLVPGAEIGFTDQSGENHWIQRSDGALEEITESPLKHYDILSPVTYTSLTPWEERPKIPSL